MKYLKLDEIVAGGLYCLQKLNEARKNAVQDIVKNNSSKGDVPTIV